jgi:hypothetical protein
VPGVPKGKIIEVLTWEVHFIPCARWSHDLQKLHVLLETLHDGDAGAASSSSAPSDTLQREIGGCMHEMYENRIMHACLRCFIIISAV